MIDYLKNKYAYFRLSKSGREMAENCGCSYWGYWNLCSKYVHKEHTMWIDEREVEVPIPKRGFLALYSEEDIIKYMEYLGVDKNHLV